MALSTVLTKNSDSHVDPVGVLGHHLELVPAGEVVVSPVLLDTVNNIKHELIIIVNLDDALEESY